MLVTSFRCWLFRWLKSQHWKPNNIKGKYRHQYLQTVTIIIHKVSNICLSQTYVFIFLMGPCSKHLSTFVTSFGLTESHSDVQFLIRALLIRKCLTYFFTVQLKLENLPCKVELLWNRGYFPFHRLHLNQKFHNFSLIRLCSDILLPFSDEISKN